MLTIRVFAVFLLCSIASAQLTQKEACQKFTSAVVQIDAGGSSRGTGFLISADGWIFTAAHVVIDPSVGAAFSTISVTLPDGSIKLAVHALPIEPKMAGRDFTLLKIENERKLPYLELGDKPDNVTLGSDITIIGFPFSALGFHDARIKDKFCLSGTIASLGQANVPINMTTAKGPSTVNVDVDVIYLQGPSVKGLSGSPIISRETGHVIAILTSKLTGIDQSLAETRRHIPSPEQRQDIMIIQGIDFSGTISSLIDTLDQQLANGLGAGTGIEDAKAAFRHLLRQRGIHTK